VGEEKYLGHMLVEAGLMDAYQVKSALGRQKKFGGRFASNVKALGFLKERELAIFLSRQIGVPAIDISQSVIKLSNFDLIPREVMQSHNIAPVRLEGNRLFLAMAEPKDIAVIDEVQFLTGMRVIEHVALLASIIELINDAFAIKASSTKGFYFGEDVSADVPKDPLGYLEIVTGDSPINPPDKTAGKASTSNVSNDQFIQAPGPTFELDALEEDKQSQPGISFDDPLPMLEPEPTSENASVPMAEPVVSIEDGQETGRETNEVADGVKKGGAKILVVDDEEDILLMVQRVLEKNDYTVVTASTGTEALLKIRDEAPDLILLDAMLPEIHGFEICQKVKASKRFANTPIIIVSAIYKGWRFKQDVSELYGADGYVEKPFKLPALLKEVDKLLHAKHEKEGDDDRETQDVTESAKREYEIGLKAYQGKHNDEALEHFTKAVKLSPFSYKLHFYLGNLYTRSDKLYQAINEYEKAVDLSPNFFPALKNLALLYQKMGFRNKALEMWERSLRAVEDGDTKKKIKQQILTLL